MKWQPFTVFLLATICLVASTTAAHAQVVIDEEEQLNDAWVELAPNPRGGWPDLNKSIVGDTAALKEKGELELTFGAQWEDEGDQFVQEFIFQVEYGVTDWFELGLEIPYQHLNPIDEGSYEGMGDWAIAGAVPLYSSYPLFVSGKVELSIPTGDEDKAGGDLGDGSMVWELILAADYALGPSSEVTVEFGLELGKHQTRVFNYEVTYATEWTYFGPFEELVPSIGIEGSFDGGDKEFMIVPGVGFPLSDTVELGLETAIGLTPESSDWRFGFELTFEF